MNKLFLFAFVILFSASSYAQNTISTQYNNLTSDIQDKQKMKEQVKMFFDTMTQEMKNDYNDVISLEFITNIEKCQPSEFTFNHPIYKKQIKRTIIGIDNNKCKYEESTVFGTKIKCDYPTSQLTEISKEYKEDRQKLLEILTFPPSADGLIFKLINDPEVCRMVSASGKDITSFEDMTEEEMEDMINQIMAPVEELKQKEGIKSES